MVVATLISAFRWRAAAKRAFKLRTEHDFERRIALRMSDQAVQSQHDADAESAIASAHLERRLAALTIERDDVARNDALAELARSNAELKQRLLERTIERDNVAREQALAELKRSNAELEQRLAERTIERDEIARKEAREELARTNAELAQRLAERTIERDNIARSEALEERDHTNARALTELARTNTELHSRLAQRTVERDDVARKNASVELARTNERALIELGRTKVELQQRLEARTIERDEVAREEALAELARTDLASLVKDFEREHRASAAFQEAALPSRLPEVPGLAFHAIYQAAKAEALVGGDWYDAFRLDDGRIVVSIGDVLGNGLMAAVTMGAVRQAIRGAAQILAEPFEILDAVDRALRSDQPDGIVTAFLGILDPITLTFVYASAGHPPPLMRLASGEIKALVGTGLPLGLRAMVPQARGAGNSIILEKSALLVLYTDGLLEATRDIEEGERKLNHALSNAKVWNAQNPAATISELVLDEVLDDVAILTIRIDYAAASVTRPVGIDDEETRWSFSVLDCDAAEKARNAIISVLREHGVAEADTLVAELIFSELLGNVMRYGGEIMECALDVSGQAAVLHALDRGPGFVYSARLPSDEFSEDGRGLYIIKSLARNLIVTKRVDGGSHARAILPGIIRRRRATLAKS